MEAIIPQNLDYKMKEKISSSYKLQRIGANEGNATFNITGSSVSTFVIPSVVQNHSKSFLRFDFTPTASATTNFFHCNSLPIHSIVLRDEANQRIVDISYLLKFFNTVCNDSISQEELTTQDIAETASGYYSGVRMINAVAVQKRAIDSNSVIFGQERKYWIVGTNASATPKIYFRIPMGLLKKTFFSQDINIYHNRNLFLEITWAPIQNWMSAANSTTEPYTTPLAYTAGNGTVANLYYELAVQTNDEINAAVKNAYNTGNLKYIIPSVISNRITRTGAGAHYVEIRVSRAHGMKLLDIYMTPYNTSEVSNVCLEHNNIAGNRISSLMASLNDVQLYPTRISCLDEIGDDYEHMKKFLTSSMTQSSNIYRYNWFWHESFHDSDNHQNVLDGIDLATEQKYSLDITGVVSAAPVDTGNLYYTFTITSKLSIFSPNGLIVQ